MVGFHSSSVHQEERNQLEGGKRGLMDVGLGAACKTRRRDNKDTREEKGDQKTQQQGAGLVLVLRQQISG